MKTDADIRVALDAVKADSQRIRLIDEKLRAFNIFEVLRVQRRELQHSNFLAYVLDPTARHGIGAVFLKDFLVAVIKESQQDSQISERQLTKWDLSASYVVREWESKDILILNAKLRFVCLIENKIGNKERLDQLPDYRRRIEQDYPNHRRLFVFLTPDRDEPSDPKWTTLGYLKVLELLETLLQRNAIKIEVFQQSVIKQYMEVLRRHVVKEDTVLAKQARDLYQRHQRAFDFIFENKPSYATSLHEHLSRFISKRNKEVRLDHESPNYFRFVPLAWDKISSLKTKAGWNNGSLISCELTTPDSEDRKLDLHIVIHMQGPRPYLKLGRSIYESVEKQKLRSKNKFLFLRRRKIPVPSEFSDDFNEEVAREIASYIRDEVPRITAGIKKAVASR